MNCYKRSIPKHFSNIYLFRVRPKNVYYPYINFVKCFPLITCATEILNSSRVIFLFRG